MSFRASDTDDGTQICYTRENANFKKDSSIVKHVVGCNHAPTEWGNFIKDHLHTCKHVLPPGAQPFPYHEARIEHIEKIRNINFISIGLKMLLRKDRNVMFASLGAWKKLNLH